MVVILGIFTSGRLSSRPRRCILNSLLTREMYHIDDDDHITCNESNPSRNRRDNYDEKKVIELLHQANIFNVNQQADVPERLQNMVTKDLTTTQIEESLLNASSLGQKKLDTFVKERLMVPKEDENRKKLRDPLPKNKALTFVSLYEAEKKEREKSAAIKADRTILQRIITISGLGSRFYFDTKTLHCLTNLRTNNQFPCYLW